MNTRRMNPYLQSMRYRALKHGSEEEYDMFEDFAICRAKNRRMNGVADSSRLQLEHITHTPTDEDDPNAAAITPDSRREGDENTVPEDSTCAGDGKRSQENIDTTAALLKAARNSEEKETSNPMQSQDEHHLCLQAEESIQLTDSSTPSNPADNNPSEDCSKEEDQAVQRTCYLQMTLCK